VRVKQIGNANAFKDFDVPFAVFNQLSINNANFPALLPQKKYDVTITPKCTGIGNGSQINMTAFTTAPCFDMA
jgi:hypothetical protein